MAVSDEVAIVLGLAAPVGVIAGVVLGKVLEERTDQRRWDRERRERLREKRVDAYTRFLKTAQSREVLHRIFEKAGTPRKIPIEAISAEVERVHDSMLDIDAYGSSEARAIARAITQRTMKPPPTDDPDDSFAVWVVKLESICRRELELDD